MTYFLTICQMTVSKIGPKSLSTRSKNGIKKTHNKKRRARAHNSKRGKMGRFSCVYSRHLDHLVCTQIVINRYIYYEFGTFEIRINNIIHCVIHLNIRNNEKKKTYIFHLYIYT